MLVSPQQKKPPFITFVFFLMIGYSLAYGISSKSLLVAPVIAAPAVQPPSPNSHAECPPNSENIWVQVNDHHPNQENETLHIPFESGNVGHNGYTYVNYLLGVLISEIGPTIDFDPVDDETMKAMAIAARTVAYQNCRGDFNGHPGIDDSEKQHYDPTNINNFSQAELDRYQQAIDATKGTYLTYTSSIFDPQYRDTSANPTNETTAPHLSVFDPAGDYHNISKTGLPQKNANHWATGLNHDDFLPQWNYRQILTHYYTGIHLQNTTGAVLTPDYRWNPLVVDWGGGSTTPLVLK
jgi:hypothetical protein